MRCPTIYPSNFSLATYQFTLKARDTLRLPQLKGSALRGGFGHTFKRLACTHSTPVEAHCPAGNDCPYGYIFETSPPSTSEVLRNLTEVPRPFVIEAADDRRTKINSGESLTFKLILIGNGTKYLSHFIAVFRALGEVGLGQNQGRYQLEAVDAIHMGKALSEPVYRSRHETLWSVNSTFDRQTLEQRASVLSNEFNERITLNFLTPTKLKQQGEWVQEAPPFAVLIRTLLSRISSLSYFHCGERFETDFRGVIDQAEQVRVKSSEVRWEDWERFSGRQKQRINMGGVVGRVIYEGELTPYLPLLTLGELVHVGKGTVFGNGQYRILAE